MNSEIVSNLSISGYFDFANSRGLEPSWRDAELGQLLEEFVKLARESGVSVGTIAKNQDEIRILEALGVTYIVFLNDLGIIKEAIGHI